MIRRHGDYSGIQKILLVANTDWYLYNFRRALASLIQERGIEVALVSPPGRYVPMLQQAGFRWIDWPVGRRSIAPWKELAALQRLARIYQREDPTLVHHFTIKPVLYGSLAARRAAVPLVVNSITGRGYVFSQNDLHSRLMRQVVRLIYSRALNLPYSALICQNESDRDYFVDTGLCSSDNAWLIESGGVDADHFAPQPEPPGVPVVLLAARMLWNKGIGSLVEAARRLQGIVPVRIVLAGQPDPGNPSSVDESQLRAWEAAGLVEWWGFCDNMRQAYARCHIVTLPTSYGEGVPRVLLEAASCGRPIVATDVPGCRNVVQHGQNGFLVPTDDPIALAESIARLASDPLLRKKMGACGRERVLQKFTTGYVNNATWGVYQTLASQAGMGVADEKMNRAA